MTTGILLLYSGIVACALGVVLLTIQLILMQKRKNRTKDASATDTIAVKVAGTNKREKQKLSSNRQSAQIKTEKLNMDFASALTEKLHCEDDSLTELLNEQDDDKAIHLPMGE